MSGMIIFLISLFLMLILLGSQLPSTIFAQLKEPNLKQDNRPTSQVSGKNGTAFVGFSKTSGTGEVTVKSDGYFVVNWSNKIPPISSEEQLERDRMLKENAKHFAPILESGNKTEPLKPGTETSDKDLNNVSNKQLINKIAYQLVAAGDFRTYRDDGNIFGADSGTAEPSIANKGRLIIVTGNHFAAKSDDGGENWQYAVASSMTPATFGGVISFDLCCDQDIIYDNNNHMFLWYMQGNGGSFKLSVSNDGDTWYSWTVRAVGFAGWTAPRQYANLWWDYPQIALTNNHLFMASNVIIGNPEGNPTPPECGGPMLGCGSNDYSHSAVLRFNLGELSSRSSFIHVSFVYDRVGFGLAQGATDTMYFAAHLSAGEIRVFKWPDNANYMHIRQFDFSIPAWNRDGRFSCPVRDGSDPCQQVSGAQVSSGWVYHNQVGFFWNVGAGGGVRFPYVDSAVFLSPGLFSEMAYQGRRALWNSNYAWVDAFASPNNRGLGLVAWKVGGTAGFPSLWAGISDSFNTSPSGWGVSDNRPNWEMHLISPGGGGVGNRIGDYLRVRSYTPELGTGLLNSPLWIGTGYVSLGSQIVIHEFVFGREADELSWQLER
jgi:hypothetical protein